MQVPCPGDANTSSGSVNKARVLGSTGGHTRKSMSVQRLTGLVERTQEKRGDLRLHPLPAWRKSPAAIFKSLWLLWTGEGNSAAVYGCVTSGKLLNLSVPQFCHVYSEDDDSAHLLGLLLKNK